MSAPLLSIRNLRVEIPTRNKLLVPVDAVSFDVARGEVLGVVGESGAGKTLTGTAIIGLLESPARIGSGQIHFEGMRIDTLPRDRMRRIRGAEIGMIFQDPLTSLNPLYRIGRQLSETLRTHGAMNERQARARALDLLNEVGIPAPEKRIEQYPHEFSGGMRQRVVIALALANNPKLIIADEPTTALDVSVQAQIIALLRRLAADLGTAVILITHNMGVIAEIADRVAVMYAGRIAEIGPVRNVIQTPAHPYTQGLMASIPRVAHGAGRLSHIDGSMPRPGAIPPGCAFHPRCPYAFDRCPRERPDLLKGSKTDAACWLLAEPAETPDD